MQNIIYLRTTRFDDMETKVLDDKKIYEIANLALDIGTFLLASGAHCGRVYRNVSRITEAWGVRVNMHITFTGLLITAQCKKGEAQECGKAVTLFKKTKIYDINFNAINEISQLSWLIAEEKISVSKARNLFKRICSGRKYSTPTLLLGIGCACACLCIVAGGDWKDAIIGFIASIAGMVIRLEIIKRNYNMMFSFIAAAFFTTLITSLHLIGTFEPIWGLSTAPDRALATAVLYLVPGVPLTNSLIDLIEGYIPSAIARASFSAFILLCIAIGMSISILLFGINQF